jgi:hypothetical protein
LATSQEGLSSMSELFSYANERSYIPMLDYYIQQEEEILENHRNVGLKPKQAFEPILGIQ